MWLKRYDNQWSWLTAVLDEENHLSHLYLNGTEVDSKGGFGSPSPFRFGGKLKKYGTNSIYLGTSPSQPDSSSYKFFKGDIARVFAWDRALKPLEVKNLHNKLPEKGLIINYDANNPVSKLDKFNVEVKEETLKIPNSIIPHRVEGRMRCLPHKDEGIVDGVFAKGETTAANERRYVLKMQQNEINYKEDGIKQLKYELVGEQIFTPWAKMLNIKL
tara:strand:- start:1344 stop:1991 length:648 start_codon:yes stop_codon:yes gene_type:complete